MWECLRGPVQFMASMPVFPPLLLPSPRPIKVELLVLSSSHLSQYTTCTVHFALPVLVYCILSNLSSP